MQIRKLHIGCGDHPIKGWINTDVNPYNIREDLKVWYLDATNEFMYPNNYFSHIFSEHMIEHITFDEGQHMLRECYRILQPGGKIRISCPDKAFVEKLKNESSFSELEGKYIYWTMENLPNRHDPHEIGLGLEQDFGHKHIYSMKELGHCMMDARFTNIFPHQVMQSYDKEFQNLENISRMPEGFLQLETMTLEGEKL